MSSYDKVVRLACKPKAAPPKAKYLDPIIAATWSDDGAVHDVCRALTPRFREPNAIVVFKALIVLHTMIRNGATDNILSYLSQSDVLRLRNVSAGSWEGYAAPQNLQHYAMYLDARIRAYRDLKHDAIRVQAETNRDMRNSSSIGEEADFNRVRGRSASMGMSAKSTGGPTRSKTIMGRKLRVMTVEKGLLRETRVVHRMLDVLVECRFYLDDLEDELTITALRMLVKDLLILFQAGNEGVINVLEHYFEMSHTDAEDALNIYRHFCELTERVTEYLGVAKKLQNLLNVPIPNLQLAPTSLLSALQEYLDDPNFEQNRIEYKTSKASAEKSAGKSNGIGKRNGAKSSGSKDVPSLPNGNTGLHSSSLSKSSTSPPPATNGTSTTSGSSNKDVVDFFSAIEQEAPALAQGNNAPPIFLQQQPLQQQMTSNPFSQMGAGQFQMMPQQTGFLVPQHTVTPGAFQQQQPSPNPFNLMIQQAQPTGHRPFSSYLPQATQQPPQQQPTQQGQENFMQAQQTGFQQSQQTSMLQPQQTSFLQPQQPSFLRPQAGLLQSQATGANPFRQSMMVPQATGAPFFGGPGSAVPGGVTPTTGSSTGSAFSAFSGFSTSTSATSPSNSAFSTSNGFNNGFNPPARPASTPLKSSAVGQQPVKTHQTGTKNPFGPIVSAPPPVPKAPTLMELRMGMGSGSGASMGDGGNMNGLQQQQLPQQTGTMNSFGSFNSSALSPGATDISSVASSFAFSNKAASGTDTSSTTNGIPTLPISATGSTFSSSIFSNLSSQPTGVTNSSQFSSTMGASQQPQQTGMNTNRFSPPIVSSPLKSQVTGFSGLKPFKPSSSFGASLLEALPSIPGSSPTTPNQTQVGTGSATGTGTGTGSSSGLSAGAGAFSTGNTGSFSTGSAGTFSNGNTGTISTGNTTPGASALSFQPTGAMGSFGSSGSTLGIGLWPQMTGGGAPNPFRTSMMGLSTGGGGAGGGMGFSMTPAFGAPGMPGFHGGLNASQPIQQQSGSASLI